MQPFCEQSQRSFGPLFKGFFVCGAVVRQITYPSGRSGGAHWLGVMAFKACGRAHNKTFTSRWAQFISLSESCATVLLRAGELPLRCEVETPLIAEAASIFIPRNLPIFPRSSMIGASILSGPECVVRGRSGSQSPTPLCARSVWRCHAERQAQRLRSDSCFSGPPRQRPRPAPFR